MRKIKLKETQKLSTDEMKSVKGGAGGGNYCDTSQICFGYLGSSLIQGICHFTGTIGNPVGMCYCMKEISSGSGLALKKAPPSGSGGSGSSEIVDCWKYIV